MPAHRVPDAAPVHACHSRAPGAGGHPTGDNARDPVCGMSVDVVRTPYRHQRGEQTYYFCSDRCRAKFAADPLKYLDPLPASTRSVPEGTIYTCPMHPEVRQIGPGACPICGMGLEPLVVSAVGEPNPELTDMSRRFWIGLALSVPVVALEMGGHLLGPTH